MADVYTTAADAWTELGVDGRVVGIRGTSTSDYGAVVTSGNGGSVTRIANGSFDGAEDALRIVPPSATVGGEGQYCGILHALELTPGGANTVRQINIRWLAEHGSTYWSHSSNSKVTGVLMSAVNASPGVAPKRAAVFDQAWPPRPDHDQKVFAVTYGTTQSYHEPDSGIDVGDEEDKLCYLRGSDNHANSPPIIGTDCVCFELVVTAPGYNGQTDGRNKLYMWTRDGVVTERYLDIPFSYAVDYDPSKIYLTDIEYLGGYWNDAGTADANNYVDYQHCALSANRGLDDPIGPPAGFLDSEPSDTTPDAFSFVDQADVALSSTITSASITVAGIDAPAAISVSGGSYDVNGSGSFTSSPGTVNNGDTVRARHTSSASHETATNTIVTIGGVSDTFTSTTEAAGPGEDTTPNAFTFTDQTDVARSTVITSAAITVAGIDTPSTITVTGGTYDINGSGTFVSTPGTVEVGDTVRAQHTSSASYSTATNTVVTIGGVSDTFTSTTEESEIIIPAHRWFRVPRR